MKRNWTCVEEKVKSYILKDPPPSPQFVMLGETLKISMYLQTWEKPVQNPKTKWEIIWYHWWCNLATCGLLNPAKCYHVRFPKPSSSMFGKSNVNMLGHSCSVCICRLFICTALAELQKERCENILKGYQGNPRKCTSSKACWLSED